MEHSIFYQLSLVLAIAVGISLVVRLLRQPPVVGYIATGLVVGPSLFNVVHAEEAFESFSQIGISLLLFMVGLGLNVAIIRRMGKPALLTFAFITLGLGAAAYGVAHLLGFEPVEALIIATALLFSSTIIVVKALSDKKDQSRLYAQIAIGILLVEDLAATLALLFVSAGASGGADGLAFGGLLLKGLALGGFLTLIGAFILPRVARFVAASQEFLFLFTLAWGFGVASAFSWAGFSLEIGSLFAGVTLAHLPYAQAISTRLKPLRDFFIVLFFIVLGVEMGVHNLSSAIVPALIFSAIIMVMKPLLTLAGLGLLGYTKQTGFKAAVHLSQISEFSIVLVVLALDTGLVSDDVITVITLTAMITITLSTYLMQYDNRLYRRLARGLSVFEKAETKREVKSLEHYPLVLLGYHKGGYEFIRTFRHMKKPYVVIDFDPDVIEELDQQGVHHIYGDATDLELLDEIGVHRSEIVVSTIADAATNEIIVSHITRRNKDALFVCHASSYDEAEALYEKGAAYVILPHFIGSEQINAFLRRNGSDKSAFRDYRKKHLVTIGVAKTGP